MRDAYDLVIRVETGEPTRAARERPWLDADLLINGGDSIPHDPTTEVVTAEFPGIRTRTD